MAKPNPRVYMDVSHGNSALGRMVFELYADTTPRTAANFLALCTGSKGKVPYCSRPLAYKNSTFHRVIKGFMAQGGDFENGNGTGGASIYSKKFPDENFTRRHISRGLLSMANAGPNTNGSQFFITFQATPFLNGKHVVFGRLVEGMRVLDAMEAAQTGRDDKPVRDLRITACGTVEDPAAVAAAAAAAAAAAKKAKAAEAEKKAAAAAAAAAAAEKEKEKKAEKKKAASVSDAEAAAVASSEASFAAGGSWAAPDSSALSARERKFLELQQRMAAARAKNAGDARAESNRLNNPNAAQKSRGEIIVGEDGEVVAVKGKGKRAEGKGKGKGKGKSQEDDDEEGDKDGDDKEEDVKLKYVDATLEDCEAWEAKKARKRAGAAAEGWEVHSMDTKYKTYEKRAATLPHTRDTGAAGKGSKPSAAQIDALVADLEAQEKVRNERRRKRHYESADMNYVNEANKTFVEKSAKHYDKFTAEVASALEKGSA